MRALLFPVLVLALSSVQVAHADSLVPGSTFSVFLEQYDTTTNYANAGVLLNLTPGGTMPFTFRNASGMISESSSHLSNGLDSFTFTFTSNSDLFPEYTAGDRYIGGIGVGNFAPLQFTTPFDVTAAYISFASPDGYFVAPTEALPITPDPFDGYYPGFQKFEGFEPIGGRDTTSIVLQIEGHAVPPATPEPSSLMLLGTGVLGAAGAARRKFRKA